MHCADSRICEERREADDKMAESRAAHARAAVARASAHVSRAEQQVAMLDREATQAALEATQAAERAKVRRNGSDSSSVAVLHTVAVIHVYKRFRSREDGGVPNGYELCCCCSSHCCWGFMLSSNFQIPKTFPFFNLSHSLLNFGYSFLPIFPIFVPCRILNVSPN